MKKERVTNAVGCVVLTLVTICLLFGEVCGASSGRPYTENSSESQPKKTAKPVQKRLEPITTDPSTFTPNMNFGEAIDILRNSTKPPLNIAVLWRDLGGNADIYRDTPIGMEGLSGIPLRKHLEILLMSVSAGSTEKLGYTVEDGVIIIATRDSLPVKRTTRIYDVTDLVAPPANYFFMPGLGMPFGYGGMPYGAPYGGYGGYGLGRRYRGSASTGTGVSRSPSNIGRSYRYDSDLVDLIETLYGPAGRSYRNDRRTRRNR